MKPEDAILDMDLFTIDIYDALGQRRVELQAKIGKANRSRISQPNAASTCDYVELALLTLLLDGEEEPGFSFYDPLQPRVVELPLLFESIKHRLLIDLVYARLPGVDTAQHEIVQQAWKNIRALCVDTPK